MKRRPFGSTGFSVSEIGLGCWQLGNPIWGEMDEAAAHRIVDAALAEGCTFFDTAPGYGEGRSEQLLGAAIQSVRDDVMLCTKFGHTADGTADFSAKAVRPALEESLRRLQTDRIDCLLLHNPPVELLQDGGLPVYEELERLKAEGTLRAYGVSLDSRRELEMVIANTRCDAVEVLFNVFHQAPLAAFQQAHAKGIALIAKVPLDSGWLSGKYRRDGSFAGIRARWSQEDIQQRSDLVEHVARLLPAGVSLSHAALRYILAQAEISTIIPGAKTPAQVQDNFAAAASPLPPETVRALHAFWQHEIQNAPLPW